MTGRIDAGAVEAAETNDRADSASGKRRNDSRRKILAAARTLFVTRGYHATRPQDIAKEAGVGHGTFYLHFADKSDCFLAFAEEARSELSDEVDRRTAAVHGFGPRIEATLNAIYDYAEQNPGVLATALSDASVIASGQDRVPLLDQWGEQWARIIRDTASEAGIELDYDPVIAGQAMLGAIHQAGMQGFRTGTARADTIRTLSTLIARALTPR